MTTEIKFLQFGQRSGKNLLTQQAKEYALSQGLTVVTVSTTQVVREKRYGHLTSITTTRNLT